MNTFNGDGAYMFNRQVVTITTRAMSALVKLLHSDISTKIIIAVRA